MLDPEIKAMHTLTRKLGELIEVHGDAAPRIMRLAVSTNVSADELREAAMLVALIERIEDETQRVRVQGWFEAKCRDLLAQQSEALVTRVA